MTDIIMYYELPERSMDSYLLIQAEMRKRGYSVKFSNNFWSDLWKNLFRIPKIVFTSGCRTLEDMSYQDGYLFKKDVVWLNLQEEQVAYAGGGDLSSFMPTGRAKEVFHFCWGDFARSYMRDAGVKESNMVSMPPLQFDLAKPRFSALYKSRETIAKEYGLDSRKKWVLFAADFCEFAQYNTEEKLRKHIEELGEIRRVIYNIERATCLMLCDWWDRFLAENDDYIIIYRPHPSEYNRIPEISELSEKHENFRIIKDYSIKQWNHVVDIFTTWISTSVMEAHYSKVPYFAVSAPESIAEKDYNISIFDVDRYITDYDTYKTVLKNAEALRKEWDPLDYNEVRRYYGDYGDCYAYEQICDYLERILKDRTLYKKMRLHLSFKEKNASPLRNHYFKVTFMNDLIVFLSPVLLKLFPQKEKTIMTVLNTMKRFDKAVYREHARLIGEIIKDL